jgi:hypothetical protein
VTPNLLTLFAAGAFCAAALAAGCGSSSSSSFGSTSAGTAGDDSSGTFGNGADNLRGFWVLPPCEQNGASCSSGDQRCSGFGRGSGTALSCVMKPSGCSNDYETCATSADCCNKADECINNRCAGITPK